MSRFNKGGISESSIVIFLPRSNCFCLGVFWWVLLLFLGGSFCSFFSLNPKPLALKELFVFQNAEG